MTANYEPPNLGSSFQQAHADRPGREIDGIPSIRALRLVNGLESAVRRSVGGISRWRRRRTLIRKLQALSDHYLTDIGLDRSQIVSTVEEIYRDRRSAGMNQNTQSEYYIGVILLVISAITYSTAGLFTKGVEAGSWDVIFWRGFFAGAFTTVWTIKRGAFRQNFFGMGYSGWAVGVVGALGTAAFIPAFKLTTIANVSLIYAVSPLIAALLAWSVMGERVSSRTMAGSVCALLGVAIIVSGSIGQIRLNGDLLALGMTAAMASIMVIYRKYPNTPGAGSAVLQSVLLLPFAAMLGNPFDVERPEVYILAAFGLLFAIASVTLAEGAKRVPSGQTALLSSLETPLAPVFAFILFTEVPNIATFLGGSAVLFSVLFSIRNDT